MGAADWILLAIVAVSAVFGLMRGFVGVVASLLAWTLAGWAALHFGADVATLLASADATGPSLGLTFAGYALCFLGVLVVVGLVGWMVRLAVKSVGLSGVDRVLGLALGTLRGAIIACAVVLLLGLTSMPREPGWQASQVVPVFVPGAQLMRGWLPDWVARQVDFGGGASVSTDGIPRNDGPALPVPAGG